MLLLVLALTNFRTLFVVMIVALAAANADDSVGEIFAETHFAGAFLHVGWIVAMHECLGD